MGLGRGETIAALKRVTYAGIDFDDECHQCEKKIITKSAWDIASTKAFFCTIFCSKKCALEWIGGPEKWKKQ